MSVVEETTALAELADSPTRSYVGGRLGAVAVPTTAAGQTLFTVAGLTLVIGGTAALAGVCLVAMSGYLRERKKRQLGENGKGGPEGKKSVDGKLALSIGTASSLMVSVGTAMLPRTRTMMIIHVTSGFLCLGLSFVHIYSYRKALKAKTKRFWKFLVAPKAEAGNAT